MTSFVEFAKGITPEDNHYVAYKLINDILIEYDDQHATIQSDFEEMYTSALVIYRCKDTTRPYTMNIDFPLITCSHPRKAQQSQQMSVAPGN